MFLRNVYWISNGLHCIIFQTTERFIAAAVVASNPTSNTRWSVLDEASCNLWSDGRWVPAWVRFHLSVIWTQDEPFCQWHDISMYSYTALVGLGRFFSFLILYTVGKTPWTGDQTVVRPLPTHRTTQTQNKRTPWVGFEPTIPVFERAKTVLASDRMATVIGSMI
jgi:hypothetical protein